MSVAPIERSPGFLDFRYVTTAAATAVALRPAHRGKPIENSVQEVLRRHEQI
jgi:hypothetical protein